MTLEQILATTFTTVVLAAGVRLAIPILLAVIGEIITEKGIGNGISLIITIGILSGLPSQIRNTASLISVADTGTGMLPEVIERAFDLESQPTESPKVLSKPARSLTGSKR